MIIRFLAVMHGLVYLSSPLRAEETPSAMQPSYMQKENEFSLKSAHYERRSYFWKPFFSFLLPGLGQWTEGQYSYAAAYSGIAIGGYVYANQNRIPKQGEDEKDEEYFDRMGHGVRERKFAFGLQTAMSMGGLSTYHSFRSAVRSQIPYGQFSFLKTEDEMSDILLAPFKFQFLARKTTWIPLTIITALSVLSVNTLPQVEESDTVRDPFTTADGFFAGGISYHAGTYEEAMFRGWVMPMFMDITASEFWSNGISSLIFAALHFSAQNQAPLPQLALGFHLGYVTQENSWSIQESIFIHTWWDVIALAGMYQLRYKEKDDKDVIMPPLILPVAQLYF